MRFRDASSPALVLGSIFVLAVSACTDARSPAAPEPSIARPDAPALAVLNCSGSARGIKCAPAASGTSLGSGALGDRIVGGQDVFVRLVPDPEGGSYDGINNIIYHYVDLQNLTVQPFGTGDWLTAVTPAVRVFFHSGPTNTGGTAGPVTVVGADGTATFTASSQPFYQYQELIPANQKNQNGKQWGFQLPDNTTTFSFQVYVSARMPDETTSPFTNPPHTFTELALGTGQHNCAVRSGGTEYCWGSDGDGQLGLGAPTFSRSTPAGVLGNLSLHGLVKEGRHTCGLTAAGDAYCWGTNGDGQLGDGTINSQRLTPVAVLGGLKFKTLGSGGRHTCGLTFAGAAYCWGNNEDGELGDGTIDSHAMPVAVSGGLTFTKLGLGGQSSCALTSAGKAYCWGNNQTGQLGDGTFNNWRTSPTAVSGGLTFTSIATSGRGHTCGTTSTATYCWGSNDNGELGDGTTDGRLTPVGVGGPSFTSVVLGANHTCALTATGVAYCWGDNNSGQLGDDTGTDQWFPTPVAGGLTYTQLSGGRDFNCGLSVGEAAAYCWGNNGSGQLGNGSSGTEYSPVAVIMP